jgi:hypothetical protein
MKDNVVPIIIGLLVLVLTILTIADPQDNYNSDHLLDGSVKGLYMDEMPLLKRVTDDTLFIYAEGTVYYEDVVDELTPEELMRLNTFIDDLDNYSCDCKTPNNYNISLYKNGEYEEIEGIEQYKMDEFNLLIEDIIK